MKKTGTGSVRIIAGCLKGSKLPVLDKEGLRPTSNRVRETVFNWIQHSIQGRRALDLFAGSGALGFEAASRLAKQVVLLERDYSAAQSLRDSKARLKIDSIDVIQADSLTWLRAYQGLPYDLVFLDPPYAFQHWSALWQALSPVLAEQALVYVEHSALQQVACPDGLQVQKRGKTSQSQFFLAQWHKPLVG